MNVITYLLLWVGHSQPAVVPTWELNADTVTAIRHSYLPAEPGLALRFSCFHPGGSKASYSITLCADIPDNNMPSHVRLKREPGHVFIILTELDTVAGSQPVNQVFGFYPHRPVSSILFKNVRGKILDNGCREYDASIQKELNSTQFRLIMDRAFTLAKKKYSLNKYNCYDYALEVFNSIPGIEKLPFSRIKFPFVLGWGGSPCCLYRDLKKLQQSHSEWAPFIKFGMFISPPSCWN